MKFRRHAVEFEAIQFTGNNYDEIRAFVGVRIAPSTGENIQIFNPIGTYLIPGELNKGADGELWVDDAKQWRPVYIGEWIVQQDEGWLSVTDEWIQINCVMLDEEMLALLRAEEEPKTFEQELESLINRHSLENESGTPDFILASYLVNCLNAFNIAVQQRANWRGERIDFIFDVNIPKKIPLKIYDEHGRSNTIGEADVTVWPGEVTKNGPIDSVVPVFETIQSGWENKDANGSESSA